MVLSTNVDQATKLQGQSIHLIDNGEIIIAKSSFASLSDQSLSKNVQRK